MSYLNWNDVSNGIVPDLDAQDRAVIDSTKYGTKQGIGERPALILVDFQNAYLGLDRPILDQLDSYSSGGGEGAWAALRTMLPVLAVARTSGIPVVLSRIAYPRDAEHDNGFVKKRGSSPHFIEGSDGARFAEELHPAHNDVLVTKQAASCFQGTSLHDDLAALGVDSIIVAGLSTSGCVRATVVDGAALGYRCAVVVDGTADRIQLSRRIALFDIWMKYGDLVTADAAVHLIESQKEK
ncbi:cysteine hydrolase family protein [Microbacterium sp. MPKO10]|uniref:cysteine hydrolase family protein n=1 Tax=Microbacterium sp. MPKO10 TaxID=2989818 RepID=UPI002236936A|nr:isochorismatase family protein [Microbacterium sp. MPKO10]MCW4459857.1 isochorismatase family protein [Microbacterium sp. MPKO10]